jgi:fatty acid desaturase
MIGNRNSRFELRGFALVLVALAWLAGIILDAWALFPPIALLAGSALCLLITIIFWRRRQVAIAMVDM